MIYLDTPAKKLEIVLAGAITTNALEVLTHFFDQIPQATTTLQRGAVQRSTSNNTTDVTIVSAVGQQGIIRSIRTITIYNKDTADATVTVKIDDGGTETILTKKTVRAGSSLFYEDGRGWDTIGEATVNIVASGGGLPSDLTFVTSGDTTITLPTTGTMATIAGSETLSNKTLDNSNIITVKDSNFTIQDNGTTTKQFQIQCSSISDATTRTWTVPDASSTFVGTDASQELTNKTLNASVGKGAWTASGTWTLPALTLGGTVTSNGQSFSGTIANLGTVTTADINGGTIDGAVIGGSSAAAGSFTTASLSGALTYGGVALSAAVTGTGNMVLSAGPTFTGTITAAVANFSGLVTGTGAADAIVLKVAASSGGDILYVTPRAAASGARIFTRNAADNAYAPMGLFAEYVTQNANGAEITRANGTGFGVFCTPLYEFDLTKSENGGDVILHVGNTSNTASSASRILLEVAGTSGGDQYTTLSDGTVAWSYGADISDSSSFKVSKASGLGSNDYLTISTSGLTTLSTLSVGASTLTGALTYGGVTLSNSVTGTGSMVLSASPTFTGTVTCAALTPTGLVDISGASAGQVQFPATQNASADANTLDDYEEGTWTPAVLFGGGSTGITYASRTATYTKIGRKVHVSCQIVLSNKGSSTGVAVISGLPFATGATNYITQVLWSNMTTAFITVLGTSTSSASIALNGSTAAATSLTALTEANFANNTALVATLTYDV